MHGDAPPTAAPHARAEVAITPAQAGQEITTTDHQARPPRQLIWRSRPAQYCSRSLNFCTFPVAVRGIASRSSTDVGAL